MGNSYAGGLDHLIFPSAPTATQTTPIFDDSPRGRIAAYRSSVEEGRHA